MSSNLVFVHGWGQHAGLWSTLTDALASQATILNLELPGHGRRPWQPPHFALDALVDAYAAEAPAQCHVVGWSLGTMLALRWAQRHPHQIGRLVLIAGTPCFGERSDWPHGTPAVVQDAFAELIRTQPDEGLQRFADLLAAGEADVRGVRRALRTQLAAAPRPAPAALMAGLEFLAHTDLRRSLSQQPPAQATLLLHGEGDTIVPLAASQWLAGALPHATLQVLPACGHAPMVSHPAEVATALKHFLDE